MTGQPPPIHAAPTPNSKLPIWSLVLGILSFICFGPLAGIAAVICGHIALSRIRSSSGAQSGHGQALAGLILGYVNIVLSIVMLPIMAGLLLPAVAKAREKAQEAQSLNNVRQIALACHAYAAEHNDTLPSSLDELAQAQNLSPSFLVSPFAEDKSQPGYELVASGTIGSFSNPGSSLLVREINPNRSDHYAVAYVDGHVEMASGP